MKKNITCVGTMVTSRIGLPDELKVSGTCEEFESTLHCEKYDGDLYLCTCTTKSKSKGKKNVLVLSTKRPLLGITRDDSKLEPTIIKLYDFTKGGTDIMDQKISKYSCKSILNRWTMVNFFYILDNIRCNATTLYTLKHKKNPRKVDSFDIGWELIMNLVRPKIEARPRVGLHSSLLSKMSFILDKEVEPTPTAANTDMLPKWSDRTVL